MIEHSNMGQPLCCRANQLFELLYDIFKSKRKLKIPSLFKLLFDIVEFHLWTPLKTHHKACENINKYGIIDT